MNHCSCAVPALLDTCPVKRKSLSSFNKYRNCISSVKNFHLGKKKDPLKSYSGNLGRYEKNIHIKSYSRGWWFLPLLIHHLSWHSHRLHSHLYRSLSLLHACCEKHAPLPHSPTGLSSTCHYLQSAPPLSREH